MSKTPNRPQYHVKVKSGTAEKTTWVKIGAAFKSDQGGYAIILDAHPIGNRMYLFEPTEPKDAGKKSSRK